MNLGIVGTGRMGQTIIRLAESKGYRIAACCNSVLPPARCLGDLILCDVVVDFSLPQSAMENIELYVENGINAIVGTTGWYTNLDHVRRIVEENEASILYASNFSTGIALVHRMLQSVSDFDLGNFETSLVETHHVNKVDSPSGTALDLAHVLDIARSNIASHRLADVKGRHEVVIQSLNESISITHEVNDLRVFAEGAILAATWLVGRTGLFTFDDVFAGQLEPSSN